jgi:hypothetical protein
MNDNVMIGEMATSSKAVVSGPDGESYFEIGIDLELIGERQIAPLRVVNGDPRTVHLESPGPNAELWLIAYSPNTIYRIQAGAGTQFKNLNLLAAVGAISYSAQVDGTQTLVIIAKNRNHVPGVGSTPHPDGTASLFVELEADDHSKFCPLSINLFGPPYRCVEVDFSVVAGHGVFLSAGDIDHQVWPAAVRMPRNGGIVLTLKAPSGARFDDLPVQFYERDAVHSIDWTPDWAVDVSTDGRHAFIADLYKLEDGHFKYRVYDSKLYVSEDPTIVNVEPSEPPSGRRPHHWRGGRGAPARPAGR